MQLASYPDEFLDYGVNDDPKLYISQPDSSASGRAFSFLETGSHPDHSIDQFSAAICF